MRWSANTKLFILLLWLGWIPTVTGQSLDQLHSSKYRQPRLSDNHLALNKTVTNFSPTNTGDSLNVRLVGHFDTSGDAWRVAVSGTYAYVAALSAGLRVIDISNPSNPTEAGYFDTGGRAFDVAVSGAYAYVADESAGLRVIDISSPTNLMEAGYFDTGVYAVGVAVSGSYAYVVGSALWLIDISNPTKPTEAGYFDFATAWDVAVSGSYAYVAAHDAGLRVIDISNPGNPTEVGYFDPTGDLLGVAVSGRYAYVTGEFGGLRVIDISNPGNPTEAGHFDTPSGAAWSVAVSGTHAYVAAEYYGLRVIDISTPGNLTEVGYFDTGGYTSGVTVSGRYAYVADGEWGLYILEFLDPGKPPGESILSQPNHNVFINNNKPTLRWQIPADSDEDNLHFKVEIAPDSSFINHISGSPFESQHSTVGFHPIPPLLQGTGNCSYTLQTSLPDGVYYWRVAAYDGFFYGETSAIYRFTIDTQIPEAPINLLANGTNPSPHQQFDNEFCITWENPADASGIACYWYKLGSEPEHNYDATNSVNADPEFNPQLTLTVEQEESLFVWLEDGAGNIDYHNNSSVRLRYHKPKDLEFWSPDEGDTLSDRIHILSNILEFEIDSCYLEYDIDNQVSGKIRVSADSLKSKYQFSYVWNAGSLIADTASVSTKLWIQAKAGIWFTTEIRFVIIPGIPTAILIEPGNEAFLHDTVSINGHAWAKDFRNYFLSLTSKNQVLKNPMLMASKIAKGKDRAEELAKLNTFDYPDGQYVVNLTVVDQNNAERNHAILITIDNTPPIAKLTAPFGDTLSCFPIIEGIIQERNLLNRSLQAYEPGKKDTILLQLTLDKYSFSHQWELIGLYGEYYLRLFAQDRCGLIAEDVRKYFIKNAIYKTQTGLRVEKDEFGLYISPGAYIQSAICLEKSSIDDYPLNLDNVKATELIVEILTQEELDKFLKPAILTIDYGGLDLNQYAENKLSVYGYEKDKWNQLGGTLDKTQKIITTAINRIGLYGLFENGQAITEDKDLQVSFQPRIFSPRGGGHDVQTAISFNLGKESNVTIKIYNPAGRLVKVLRENEQMSHGNNIVYWDGKDQQGEFCVSGLYIVTIQAEEKMATKTVVVLNKY